METIYKIIEDCEVKKVGDRQYEFTASTSTQDRDGEVIDAAGWDLKNFKKNPVIMYAHDYRTLPIGKAPRVWLHDGKLKNTVEFPPEGTYEFADIVERLVDTGYLKTESVGFIPRKWEDGDGENAPRRTYTKQELLEISIVPVPSNPDALRNAVAEGVITTKELKTITEIEDKGDMGGDSLVVTPMYYNIEAIGINGGGAITKPEETDEYIRIPVKGEEGKHEGHRIRTIDIDKDKGIKALYCGECKKVITYLFDKEKGWTMAKANAWIKEHEGKSPSQEEIIDEIDYLATLLRGDLSQKVKLAASILVEEIIRLTGGDIPDDIDTITYQEIQEAVKRIANKQEV